MATAVLTNVPATISTAESTTGWTGDTFALEPDVKKQGSNSVACAITPNAGSSQEIYYTGFTAANLSAVHLRMWFQISFIADLATTNAIQIFISDGTNTAYWTVYNNGPAEYGGGWVNIVVDTASTPTSGTKPTGNSTRVGMRFSVASKPRNVPANAWFDAWYYGDGYTVTGGTSGDEIDYSHIAALDLAQAYGVVEVYNEVYFAAGDISIGSGATTTYFSSGQKIQFKNLSVSSTLYAITFQGSACNIDIAGGSYGAAGAQDFLFDASDTNINSFAMTGVQFNKANSILFDAGQSITSCVFDDCGQVDPSTATFTGHRFTNSTDTGGAVLWPSDDTNINNLSFSICDNDIEYDATSDSTPNFFNIVHDDNSGDYDVNNTSGGAVTIPLTGTSNGNSYNPGGSTVTFSASVTLTFHITDEVSGADIESARINIVNATTKAELYQISTNSSGIATQSHTYAGNLGIEGWVRQFDISGVDYASKDFAGTIESTGFSTSIKLTPY